jgi:hypothetical protein
MADMLARNGWSLALRGVLAIIFGSLAWVWPEITLPSLVLLFGAYLLVDGILLLSLAFRLRNWAPLGRDVRTAESTNTAAAA